MKKLKVTYYQRKPYTGHWSIEYIFKNLRNCLLDDVESIVKIAKYTSNGFFKRLYISIEAIFYQSQINHITGDIHFVALFLKKSKTILTIHDCGILRESSQIKKKIFLYFWYYLPSKRVTYITAVSEFSKNEILSYIPTLNPEKIIVIPSAVSEKFVYKPKEVNKKKPFLLQIGTAPNKNLQRLIEAIDDIPCTLTIIGVLSSEQLSHLQKHRIEYLNRVNISEEDIVQEYLKADIVTFVSTIEGFGMPIIEANRTGRVVVTSSCTSMPEVGLDAACYVNPYDVHSIKAGINKVINDDVYRFNLIEKGFKNANRFKNLLIAEQYYNLYQTIINR